jgi:thioredoxin-dependent peroxiredoxin
LTATGLSIYGLSTDSPKANTTFKTKQELPYPLLCDPNATLIGAIGFKKAPKSTTRAVFVVEKSGKVLAAEAGSPPGTVEVVKRIVAEMGGDPADKGIEKAEERAEAAEGNGAESKLAAETAAEVADSAAKVNEPAQ